MQVIENDGRNEMLPRKHIETMRADTTAGVSGDLTLQKSKTIGNTGGTSISDFNSQMIFESFDNTMMSRIEQSLNLNSNGKNVVTSSSIKKQVKSESIFFFKPPGKDQNNAKSRNFDLSNCQKNWHSKEEQVPELTLDLSMDNPSD